MAPGRLARMGGYVALKRYFLPVAISAIFVLFCSVIALWVVLERPYGTSGTTIVAIIAQAGPFIPLAVALVIPLAVALGISIWAASTRKPFRSSNYPRIEHLRIAGKYNYHAVRSSAEMGISPLHLRG